MTWLRQLGDVARRTGHPVVEVDGWKSRGHGEQPAVRGIVCHHTGGHNDLAVVIHGRSDLAGPLSHYYLSRLGRIYVVAAGRCWHNAPSTDPNFANSAAIGIEAENRGNGESWPSVQLDAYARLCAELCREFRLPASRVKGHKEVNTAKDDPRGINMPAWRDRVAALLKGETMNADEIAEAVWQRDGHVDNPIARERAENPKVRPGWLVSDLHTRVQRLEAAMAKLTQGQAELLDLARAERPVCPPKDGA